MANKHTFVLVPVLLGSFATFFSLQFIFILGAAYHHYLLSTVDLSVVSEGGISSAAPAFAKSLPFLWLYLCLLLSTPKQLVLAGLKPYLVLLN